MDLEYFDNLFKETLTEIREFDKRKESLKREIRMWREKYLCTLPNEAGINSGAYIWHAFLCTECDDMIEHGPQKIIEKIYEDQKTRNT